MRACVQKIMAVWTACVLMIAIMPSGKAIDQNMSDTIIASGKSTDAITWTLDKEGTLTLTGTGKMGSRDWYAYNDDIKCVIIGSGITSVSENAFANCENLTNIQIASSVKDIEANAFSGTNFRTIDLPDGLERVGEFAFQSSSLQKICIPDSVTVIERDAFAKCSHLKEVTFPNGFQKIAKRTFAYCTNLSEITLGTSIDQVGVEAFDGCTGLQTIRFLGNSPKLAYHAFQNVQATVYYASGDFTWTDDILQDYGGTLTWCADDSIPVYQVFEDVSTDVYYYKPVRWAYHHTVTAGTSEATFSPNKSCTRAEAIQFLFRAYKGEKSDGNIPFTDVSQDDWFYDAVRWAYQEKIAEGVSKNAFAPNRSCTRAEIIQLIWAAEGRPEPKGNPSFTDIRSTDWYYKAICWAKENKIAAGTSATIFSPNNVCARAHIVTFLYNNFKDDIL